MKIDVDWLKPIKSILLNSTPSYFILDSLAKTAHGDELYKKYMWNPKQFNRIKEGDLFIYRKPSNARQGLGFSFIGWGKIANIFNTSYGNIGNITDGNSFLSEVEQKDIETYNWSFKYKSPSSNFKGFFNQYGMNKINKQDFIYLLLSGFYPNAKKYITKLFNNDFNDIPVSQELFGIFQIAIKFLNSYSCKYCKKQDQELQIAPPQNNNSHNLSNMLTVCESCYFSYLLGKSFSNLI